jgi:F0F1-type ATP synthase assembly protein I
MQTETALSAVGHAIQLSLAPVFLLTAIGAFLGVLTNRLGRVIDGARAFEARLSGATPDETAHLHSQLATLSRRAKLINKAITLCTITALFICGVVAALFLGAFLHFGVATSVAVLFVAATISLIAGLLYFLREIFIATAALRIGVPAQGKQKPRA